MWEAKAEIRDQPRRARCSVNKPHVRWQKQRQPSPPCVLSIQRPLLTKLHRLVNLPSSKAWGSGPGDKVTEWGEERAKHLSLGPAVLSGTVQAVACWVSLSFSFLPWLDKSYFILTYYGDHVSKKTKKGKKMYLFYWNNVYDCKWNKAFFLSTERQPWLI